MILLVYLLTLRGTDVVEGFELFWAVAVAVTAAMVVIGSGFLLAFWAKMTPRDRWKFVWLLLTL